MYTYSWQRLIYVQWSYLSRVSELVTTQSIQQQRSQELMCQYTENKMEIKGEKNAPSNQFYGRTIQMFACRCSTHGVSKLVCYASQPLWLYQGDYSWGNSSGQNQTNTNKRCQTLCERGPRLCLCMCVVLSVCVFVMNFLWARSLCTDC